MKTAQRTAFYIVAAAVFVFGLFLIIPNPVVGPVTDTSQTGSVSYRGVEGRTALELLKQKHNVVTQKFDFGEMVISIDGRESDQTTFWAFYVNGQFSDVGASDYQTKFSDTVEWRLENIEQ